MRNFKKRAEDRAFVSTKSGQTAADAPRDVPLADAKTPIPPPDTKLAQKVETPNVDADAGPPANVDQEGHADGTASGTEKDPLKARAVDLYRDRIRMWFSRRFRVSGSGLGPEEIVKYRVAATISIVDGLACRSGCTKSMRMVMIPMRCHQPTKSQLRQHSGRMER